MNHLLAPAARPAQALFAALLGVVLGAALQLQQASLWDGWVYAALLLLAPVGYVLADSQRIALWGRLAGVLLALTVAGVGAAGLRAALQARHALDPALEGRDLQVVGVVSNLPQRNEAGLRFRLEVETAQLDGQNAQLPPRIDMGWYGGVYSAGPAVLPDGENLSPLERPVALLGLNRLPADVQAGERWQMTLRAKAPHGSLNPHGFDYELWMWEQGVQASGYVRASPKDAAPVRLAQTWRYPVTLARQSVRERIYAQVQDRKWAGMIAALVVGDQNAIDRVDWDVFRATGVAHLVSISGLHITMFAWGAALLLGWLWRRSTRLCLAVPAPSAALVGGVLLATLYALFSGWGVPAQRTCLMLATVALLRLSGARWPWQHIWMLACAVVVVNDPWALMQAGFWLSFVAVGVLFASDLGLHSAQPPEARGARLAAHVAAMLREQWVITVALTPLTLLLFGQVSLVGLLANAVAIPAITLLVTPLAMLGALVPGLWDGAALALQGLFAFLQWLASWPLAAVSLALAPLWVGACGVIGGLVLVLPWPAHMRLWGLPLLLPIALWRAPLPPPGEFELLAADIGQGNAVLVRTANHALLYDAGPRYNLESDAGHRVLVPLLQALHTRLDVLVLSHRDMDHVGGAPAVLTMQPQATLLSSIALDNQLQALRTPQRCMAGQRWQWDGVDFEILHPQAQDYDASAKSNAMSCVLRVSAGEHSALLAGDIEAAQEARLTSGVRSTLLLVPHHGSKTSSSAEFLDAVAPQVALVQAGYRNRFGHPAAPVLARYQERHIEVVDTPHCGAFTWQSWRTNVDADAACARMQARRYWHHRLPD